MSKVLITGKVFIILALCISFAEQNQTNVESQQLLGTSKGKEIKQQALATNMPFASQVSEDFMKKVMETSKKIESIREKIEARKVEIFYTNEEVKQYFEKQKELQRKINAILDKDPELSELKMKRDILFTVMPQIPRIRNLPLPHSNNMSK